jgi:UDPglucose--hexose-1-phosphate uridylyltransferase
MGLYELMIPPDDPDETVHIGPNDWGILLARHFLLNGRITFKYVNTPTVELSTDHVHTDLGRLCARQYWMSINRINANKSNRSNNSDRDVFNEIINGNKPDIPITVGRHVYKKRLFSCRPEASELDNESLAFTFPNKNAYGFRCAQQGVVDEMRRVSLNENVFRSFKPCLVTIAGKFPADLKGVDFQMIGFTPEPHLEEMLLNKKLTIEAFIEEAGPTGVNEISVYSFCNQGGKSGASQPRLHFQEVINFDQAGHEINFESNIQGFITDNCRMCQSTHVDEATGKSRLLYRNEYFDLWLASSPLCDYHLRFAPKRHIQRYTDLTINEVKAFANVLKFSDLVLTLAGVTKHRNINLSSLPYGYDTPEFHFHGDILPVQYFGALERCYAISIAYKDPLDAYEELKKSQKVIDDKGLSSYDYEYN